MKIEVLDKGFVELIDSMPKENMDLRVVQCARTSFNGTIYNDERDYKLLKYLIEHKHLSPLEHCKFTFRIKAPIVVLRQWMRYRTGVFSEISYRYIEVDDDDFYIPSQWRFQSESNKQGSSDKILPTDEWEHKLLLGFLKDMIDFGYTSYKRALEIGVAREQARLFLPAFALYTTVIWTVDLRNLLHFLNERLAENAQWEIRQYAKAIFEIARHLAPKTIEYSGLLERVL